MRNTTVRKSAVWYRKRRKDKDMDFSISKHNISRGAVAFIGSADEWSGVMKIAGRVSEDMKAVFGAQPQVLAGAEGTEAVTLPVLFGTAGKSKLIANLGKAGLIDLKTIEGKREVFTFAVLKDVPKKAAFGKGDGAFKTALVIAGSEKRGTVYGLFHLSEMLGVSPFIDWLDMKPARLSEFTLEEGFRFVSKEPSVRFRGFFINDEWPAFGNFCAKNYGGFNAKAYVHVFELLLRLKGNYLWPAMWSAIFPNDGPGLENAILADELGVVMGASHHEPCCRQGEEYRYVRGKDSVYGDAWNFNTNEKGITRFWEDGLKRSGKFENVITVGMRGEADTAILGREATLADNIDLLRRVLKTQNGLIKKHVNKDLDKVPRMLALYKEVEPYFYGDETTPGLMGDPELEGVTLMLCDDNYGNLRTLPTPEMRDHKGGYGMYYHLDYHGYPISFEWYNTSFLPKVWEQMTTAYDNGIRELWIVNVGDIFSNEYPLAYFLDLAYDFDRYGTSDRNSAVKYTKAFPAKHFAGLIDDAESTKMAELLRGYTKLTVARRTEAMNDTVYAPFAYGECDELIAECDHLIAAAEKLRASISEEAAFGYYELVYLPVVADLTVMKMWALTTQNHAYASFGSTYALKLAKEIDACYQRDRELVEELHTIHKGKWYGMGMSEHIGFKYWCEEECQNPVVHTFVPADKDRLIVTIPGTSQHTEGTPWTARVLTMGAFLDPRAEHGTIGLSTASAKPIAFTVENPSDSITISKMSGTVKPESLMLLKVTIDRTKVTESTIFEVKIHGAAGHIRVRIPVCVPAGGEEAGTFLYCAENSVDMSEKIHAMPNLSKVFGEGAMLGHYISIEAEHFFTKKDTKAGSFEILPDYGRTLSAVKAFPQDVTFTAKDAPGVTYRFTVPSDGRYFVSIYQNPSNPPVRVPELFFGIGVNDGRLKKINAIPEGFRVGDGNDAWASGVLDNVRVTTVPVELKKGTNTVTIYAISPNFVLEKLVVFKEGEEPARSYLGPKESYRG